MKNNLNTKERILSLAVSLFAQKGYNGVSMRELARASNLGVAGIYHYFPDKQTLYQEAIKQCFSSKVLPFSSIWQADVSPKNKLRLFVHCLLKVMLDDKDFHNLLQHELLLADEVRLKLLADNIFRDEFNELLKLSSELFPQKPAYLTAISILSLVFSHLELQSLGRFLPDYQEKYDNIDRLTEHIVSLLLGE